MPAAGAPIAILIEEGFDDDELERILSRLTEAGTKPVLVAPLANRTYTGRHRRLSVTPDVTAASATHLQAAAVLIPGGHAPDRIRMRHGMLDLVRGALAAGIPVGAVGHGAQVLISAGAVAGRTITCWPSIAIDVKNAGGSYVDRPTVEDRGVITARKADDVPAFTDAVFEAIRRSR